MHPLANRLHCQSNVPPFIDWLSQFYFTCVFSSLFSAFLLLFFFQTNYYPRVKKHWWMSNFLYCLCIRYWYIFDCFRASQAVHRNLLYVKCKGKIVYIWINLLFLPGLPIKALQNNFCFGKGLIKSCNEDKRQVTSPSISVYDTCFQLQLKD